MCISTRGYTWPSMLLDVARRSVSIRTLWQPDPAEQSASPEVLLAWQMKFEPLPCPFCGPVRVVVPGFIGAQQSGGVTAITVQPGASHYLCLISAILPADADADTSAGRRDFAGAQLRHPRPHRWRRRTGRGATIRGYGWPAMAAVSNELMSLSTTGSPGKAADLHAAPSQWSRAVVADGRRSRGRWVSPHALTIPGRCRCPNRPGPVESGRGYGNNAGPASHCA